jgi:pimeloyl-ACP methyl ester carboxylesterase
MLKHEYADVNGIRLHYATTGTGKLILFLHGFPAFWYTWRDQLAAFGQDYQVVAPDLRGYNLSAKPTNVEQYRLSYLVEDVRALADHLGHMPFVLVGHDWGGVIAWAFAAAYPSYLEKLIVINVPPLNLLRRALYEDAAQRQRCEYMLMLHSPEAESILAADNYALLVNSELRAGLERGHFSDEDRQAYITAWSQPNALTGGVNYYRAARFVDLFTEEGRAGVKHVAAAFAVPPVGTPTLLIWGEQDPFKGTYILDDVAQSVPNLTIKRIPNGSHWVVYEYPTLVNAAIREFIENQQEIV